MSAQSQAPSGLRASKTAVISRSGVGRVVYHVEGGDVVELALAHRFLVGVRHPHVGRGAGGAVGVGAVEGVLGGVVADERGVGECLRHRHRCRGGAAAHVGDAGTGFEAFHHAFHLRQDLRHQLVLLHKRRHALDAAGAGCAVVVVGEAEAGFEHLRHPWQGRVRRRHRAEAAGEEEGVAFLRQYRRGFGREREASVLVIDLLHAGLMPQPFAQPAFVQAGVGGEFHAVHRSGLSQGLGRGPACRRGEKASS